MQANNNRSSLPFGARGQVCSRWRCWRNRRRQGVCWGMGVGVARTAPAARRPPSPVCPGQCAGQPGRPGGGRRRPLRLRSGFCHAREWRSEGRVAGPHPGPSQLEAGLCDGTGGLRGRMVSWSRLFPKPLRAIFGGWGACFLTFPSPEEASNIFIRVAWHAVGVGLWDPKHRFPADGNIYHRDCGGVAGGGINYLCLPIIILVW